MVDKKPAEEKQNKKEFKKEEKERRGWWFSIFFFIVIISLVIFLSYVDVKDSNRDVLVGLFGVLFGNIPHMITIASGRSPEELEEIKEKLSAANSDRAALIARLRDAQIQMQLLREQIFELQSAVINKLSIFTNNNPIKTLNKDNISLHEDVEAWIPNDEEQEKN